jgi:hypothetical protein
VKLDVGPSDVGPSDVGAVNDADAVVTLVDAVTSAIVVVVAVSEAIVDDTDGDELDSECVSSRAMTTPSIATTLNDHRSSQAAPFT